MTHKTHINGARIDDAKQFTPAQKKLIRDNVIGADFISFVGEGTQLRMRYTFFYTFGGTTMGFENDMQKQLSALGINVWALQDYPATGEFRKTWPHNSYWQVTFMLK